MKIWLSQHARALGATLGGFARAPLSTLFNVGVIGVALALPAGFYVALTNLQSLAHGLPARPQISIFMALDAGRADVAQIENRLRQHGQVEKFRFIPREQALAEMQAGSGLGDLMSGLAHNPLPDAFVVDAREGAAPLLEKLRGEFARWPRVAHVQLDSAWARRLEAVLGLGQLVVLVLATLLAFALVAVTFNTIRLQILTRREEIEVAKLIGATDAFIRRPFLYFGALQGFAGGLAAWALIWAGIYLLNDGLAELSQLYGTAFQLRHLSPPDSLSLLLFAAALGWFGAWMSVSRHLSSAGKIQ